jgi:hypothetical protein
MSLIYKCLKKARGFVNAKPPQHCLLFGGKFRAKSPDLSHKQYTSLERLAGIYTTLFQQCIKCRHKKFDNIRTRKHIEWQQNKMKCSLAAQVLSESVASAIDFCREDLKLDQFQFSRPTSEFIR